ncbi:MAG: ABC transporter permease [Bacteroidetes bacterium]|nr:ABC transporter permease [Bacteroidota bacterium]
MGVALGVAALIIVTSVLNGFELEIKNKVAGLVSHIQLNSFEQKGIVDYPSVISRLKNEYKDITGISPYVQREALIKYKDNVEGIILKGVDQKTDISTAKSRIVSGDFNLTPIDTTFSRLLIGDKLAKKLNVEVGKKVFVFGLKGVPSPVNPPKIKQFIVAGTYETGLKDYDDVLIYTDIATTQKLFEFGNNISGIEMNMNNIDNLDATSASINDFLGYPYSAKSMFKIFRTLFTWVELQKTPAPIILSMIILVATFNIVGTLLMLVLEKTNSIGILKSLGSSNGDIMEIFIFDGLIIGFVGIILGNIIGIGLCFLELKFKFFALPEFYYMKNVPILLQPEYIVIVSLISFALCFLATTIPAYFASKISPIKSLKFA